MKKKHLLFSLLLINLFYTNTFPMVSTEEEYDVPEEYFETQIEYKAIENFCSNIIKYNKCKKSRTIAHKIISCMKSKNFNFSKMQLKNKDIDYLINILIILNLHYGLIVEILDLSFNKITTLPSSIINLNDLKELKW